jgi:GPI mannosyltransferase 3
LWLVAPALLMGARLRDGNRRAGVAAGALLALAFAVRFQLAPALGLFALWGCGMRWRAGWAPVLLGAAIGLGIDALADLAIGQAPFLWVIRNVSLNLLQSRAASYGVAPAGWYATQIWCIWQWVLPLILLLTLVGARRFPVFLLAALVLIAFHSAIAHKEYRFILSASLLLILLAAIGTGDAVEWAARGRPERVTRLLMIAGLGWLCLSAAVALGDPLRDGWRVEVPRSRLLVWAGQVPGVCGVALYRPALPPSAAAALINHPATAYLFEGGSAQADMLAHRAAFNVMIAARDQGGQAGPSYRIQRCAEAPSVNEVPACLFVRAGGCAVRGAEAFGDNTVISQTGH